MEARMKSDKDGVQAASSGSPHKGKTGLKRVWNACSARSIACALHTGTKMRFARKSRLLRF
jgi:hypothetical protein